MFEYIAVIAFILILSPMLLCKKRFPKVTIIYTLLCFAVLLVISFLRIRIGFDYLIYSRAFFKMGMDGFEVLSYGRMEKGFVLLTKTVVYLTRDIRIYWAVIALISLAGPCFVICKYSKRAWLSVLLYVNFYFFYLTMNFIRQSLALSITMFAFPFLVKKKIFPYIIPYIAIILLASTFHRSAWFMIPLYFIIRIKPSYKIPVAYLLITTIAFVFSDSIIDHLGKIDILAKYAYTHYRTTKFWAEGIDLYHGLIPTIVMITCVCFIMKFSKYNRLLVTYSNILYFSYIFTFVMLKHAILERVSYYSYIYVILYIPEFMVFLEEMHKDYLDKKIDRLTGEPKDQYDITISNPEPVESTLQSEISPVLNSTVKKYKRRRKIVAVCVTAVVVIGTTLYNISGLLAGEAGVHGVYPYQTWLYDSPGTAEE